MSRLESNLKAAGFDIHYRAPGELKLQKCPLHKDKTPSLSINIEKNRYNCFSCGDKGTIKKLLSYFGIGSYNAPDVDELEKLLTDESESIIEQDSYRADECELINYRYFHPYLKNRGLSREFILANKIGFDKKEARVTIPIYFNGTYYGCAKRTVIDETPKITYNYGMPKNKIVYQPLTNTGETEYLIVVEGPIDALKASYLNQDSVAILGCHPSKAQIDHITKIANGRTIILALDNDAPGKKGIEKWIDLTIDISTSIMIYPIDVKDIGEMDREQFSSGLSKSQSFWEL
jgi:DNA primase